MKDKIIEILETLDIGPSYAQAAVYNQTAVSFREKLATRIEALYSPEINEEEIEKATDIYADEHRPDGKDSYDIALDFDAGVRWALSKAAKPVSEERMTELFDKHCKDDGYRLMHIWEFKAALKELNK